ncbi:MAG: TetR/AcrR family transcriptional regulator [Steroidobacteraceae bacterium]|nr:TetR/AcrR family transcriptional regulator [Steroidobacteraceae bacterium]
MDQQQTSPALLSFIEHLERQLRTAPPKQKGLRTRQRLKIATARILARDGYHAMRVADISARARLAEGSFYVYFRDKTDAALTVLSELLEEFLDLEARPRSDAGGRTQFDAIRAANRRWIAVCRANAGLMRCVLQLGDEDPRLAELVRKGNQTWYERIARSSSLRRGIAPDNGPALFVAYMLGSMMDELVRKLIVYPDSGFHALLKQLDADDDTVADAASIIFLHVLHPGMPAPSNLPRAARELVTWLGMSVDDAGHVAPRGTGRTRTAGRTRALARGPRA